MVIERALEKMKHEAQAKRPAAPEVAWPRTPAGGVLPPGAPAQQRPSWPVVQPDERVAEASRVFLPQTAGMVARPDAAYRILRTRLIQQMRKKSWTTISVTSPGPGEGKSLTAINLALSMAREKSREIFLLDMDLRNPSLCRYLGVRAPCEIAECLAGQVAPADVLFSIAGVDNLTLAGGAYATESASELLSCQQLEALISYIKAISVEPVILLDLPPILVTDEALLVAPRVDATLLVVSEAHTNRESLSRTKQMLQGFALAGIVLNFTTETFGADPYYQYRYGAS